MCQMGSFSYSERFDIHISFRGACTAHTQWEKLGDISTCQRCN